jgi:hypothetical protein
LGNAESMDRADEGQCRRRRNWVQAAGEIPGDVEDGMPSQNEQQKHLNHSWVAWAERYSEGIGYKLLDDEVTMCLRVGWMGPNK